MEIPMIIIKITAASWIIFPLALFGLFKYAQWKRKQARTAGALVKQKISQNQSLSTRYGQISEQFFPFSESYPYNHKNFRFLGSPIDGVQFEEDKVILIEFKTNKSQMSAKQKKIRDLIRDKKIEFKLLTAA